MKVLILNWRDPKNPKSGGAEKLNLHILKPMIDRGDSVTWYAMSVERLPKKEKYEGITIIRYGNPLTHLLLWPFIYWTGRLGKPDLIIDAIHGTGYLSSFVAPSKKKIILICEVAQNIWDEMYPFPVSAVGKLWEKVMFKFYSQNMFWTISQSTKNDLVRFGIKQSSIEVLPMGFDAITLDNLPSKYNDPTALFVGRLAEMKGIKDAIRAISEVNKVSNKKWKLRIIGRGEKDYENQLQTLVNNLELDNFVNFLGFVDEKKKFEEMAKSWVLLVPSSREGWGMIVPEANSVGTPVIGYDVPGLRDVIRRYSKENILISQHLSLLSKHISEIHTPVVVRDKSKSGWDDLYSFISKTT